jgi:hypothetical protein
MTEDYTPVGIGDKLLLYTSVCTAIVWLSPSFRSTAILISAVTLAALWYVAGKGKCPCTHALPFQALVARVALLVAAWSAGGDVEEPAVRLDG